MVVMGEMNHDVCLSFAPEDDADGLVSAIRSWLESELREGSVVMSSGPSGSMEECTALPASRVLVMVDSEAWRRRAECQRELAVFQRREAEWRERFARAEGIPLAITRLDLDAVRRGRGMMALLDTLAVVCRLRRSALEIAGSEGDHTDDVVLVVRLADALERLLRALCESDEGAEASPDVQAAEQRVEQVKKEAEGSELANKAIWSAFPWSIGALIPGFIEPTERIKTYRFLCRWAQASPDNPTVQSRLEAAKLAAFTELFKQGPEEVIAERSRAVDAAREQMDGHAPGYTQLEEALNRLAEAYVWVDRGKALECLREVMRLNLEHASLSDWNDEWPEVPALHALDLRDTEESSRWYYAYLEELAEHYEVMMPKAESAAMDSRTGYFSEVIAREAQAVYHELAVWASDDDKWRHFRECETLCLLWLSYPTEDDRDEYRSEQRLLAEMWAGIDNEKAFSWYDASLADDTEIIARSLQALDDPSWAVEEWEIAEASESLSYWYKEYARFRLKVDGSGLGELWAALGRDQYLFRCANPGEDEEWGGSPTMPAAEGFETLWPQVDYDEALSYCTEVLDLSRKLVALMPGEETRKNLAVALKNLADVVGMKDPAKASELLREREELLPRPE